MKYGSFKFQIKNRMADIDRLNCKSCYHRILKRYTLIPNQNGLRTYSENGYNWHSYFNLYILAI